MADKRLKIELNYTAAEDVATALEEVAERVEEGEDEGHLCRAGSYSGTFGIVRTSY